MTSCGLIELCSLVPLVTGLWPRSMSRDAFSLPEPSGHQPHWASSPEALPCYGSAPGLGLARMGLANTE